MGRNVGRNLKIRGQDGSLVLRNWENKKERREAKGGYGEKRSKLKTVGSRMRGGVIFHCRKNTLTYQIFETESYSKVVDLILFISWNSDLLPVLCNYLFTFSYWMVRSDLLWMKNNRYLLQLKIWSWKKYNDAYPDILFLYKNQNTRQNRRGYGPKYKYIHLLILEFLCG